MFCQRIFALTSEIFLFLFTTIIKVVVPIKARFLIRPKTQILDYESYKKKLCSLLKVVLNFLRFTEWQ